MTPDATRAPRVVIVGGGITGLAAAFRLQTQARAAGRSIDITLLERDERLGGKIGTMTVDGFVLERGPDIFLARKPRGVGLCEDLGLADRLQPTIPENKGSYIQKGGRLYPLPDGLSGLIPTRLAPMVRSPLLSARGKARMALDWLLPARRDDDDESVAAFVTRRLGREVYEQLVEPLLGGIYGGHGHTLSLAATFPQLRDLERAHGGLIRGLLARQRSMPEAPKGGAFVTLPGGMGELIDTLAQRLDGVTLHTNCTATHLDRTDAGYRVHTSEGQVLAAEAVLLTTPTYAAAPLVSALNADLGEALNAFTYGSTAVLWLAYRLADVPRPLDAYGYIIPRTEGKRVLACTWTHAKVAGRAPDGSALIRVFLGRGDDAEALLAQDDAALLALARDELRATLGIAVPPLFHRTVRWHRAMPQYLLGHQARIQHVEERLEAHPGLYVAGAAYHGVGIPDCIAHAEQTAERIFTDLHHA